MADRKYIVVRDPNQPSRWIIGDATTGGQVGGSYSRESDARQDAWTLEQRALVAAHVAPRPAPKRRYKPGSPPQKNRGPLRRLTRLAGTPTCVRPFEQRIAEKEAESE